jgi:membrane protein YqaA with SNARE-associated domain
MTADPGPRPAAPAPPTGLLATPRRWLRRLYDWTVAWSERRSATAALFAISFAESSFFPIPPDPLLMAICVVQPRRWLRTAAICTVGSVLGGLLGYLIGWGFMEAVGSRIVAFYHAEHYWQRVVEMYTGRVGVLFLAVAAFTPIPYKVATIAAGATAMPLLPFAVVSALGRGARFFLVAGLLRLFGVHVKQFIEKYFDWLSLTFVVLLVLGFVAVKLFF